MNLTLTLKPKKIVTRTAMYCLTAALAIVLVPAPGQAEETAYRVETLRYTNNGAYLARPVIEWRRSNGSCTFHYKDWIGAGRTVDFKVGGQNGSWTTSCNKADQFGTRISMRIRIKVAIGGRDTSKCDGKGDLKLIASKVGGTIHYKTIGATMSNNGCRIESKPSDKHIIAQ